MIGDAMAEATVLRAGIVFGESPRWHDGRLWFCDWGARQVIAVTPDGAGEVVLEVDFDSMPMCIDFLPDGRLLIVCSPRRQLLVREPDGSLSVFAELGEVIDKPWNEVVVDAAGNAFVNSIGYEFPGEDPGPGLVAVVAVDGSVRKVAGDLRFPNGMTFDLDGSTLLVAESHGERVTAFDVVDGSGTLGAGRVWASTPGDHPDGICLDAEGALWYADVGNARCVRVREGGEILDVVQLDRGCFACELGGEDGRTLFIVAQRWGGDPRAGAPTGQLLAVQAPVPAAGW
jgi:sugar lactone lactonase YvrE